MYNPLMAIQDIQAAPTSRGLHRHLYVQVLAAIALGALIGHFWPDVRRGA